MAHNQAIHIVKRPLITEKANWEGDRYNRYTFEVAVSAGKPEIKAAIEELYGVKVEKVRTMLRKGNYFRTRFRTSKKSDWKKAVVELKEGDTIELF